MSAEADQDKHGIAYAASDSTAARRQVALLNNRVESSDLFAGTREITIGHASDTYRLRITAQNKLILTK